MLATVVAAVWRRVTSAGAVGELVERHPTLKRLAPPLLILIGVIQVAGGLGTEIENGYIYFAMTLALGVGFLNTRLRAPFGSASIGARG